MATCGINKTKSEVKRQSAVNACRKTYSVGIYARLSVDSHNKKNESVETQIEIAKAFLQRQPDMVLFDCYSDLGKTGTNFDRDGFERLMKDVRLKKVNCIIVKDFSRFGRNYIETGNYIQKIFPFLGVRFVAVTDHFDSLYAENDEMGMNLKNMANEMYARDIAVKVKSSRQAQWEKGSFTGGIPPYGYRAQWADGRKCLLVDKTAAAIVKELYGLYDSGKSRRELISWLYEKKVHRPKDYRRYGHVFYEEGDVLLEWTAGTIKLLLTNPVYMGCLVQARTCGKEYKMRGKHDIASGDWSIKENAHEEIITPEQFFRIAERFEKQERYCNKNGYSRIMPKEENVFEGILFCGDCGSRMGRVSSVKEFSSGDRLRVYGYFCRNSSRIDEFRCEKKYITCHILMELVKAVLKQEAALNGMKTGEMVKRNKKAAEEKKQEVEKSLNNIQKKIEKGKRKGSEIYRKYRSGEMAGEIFFQWKEEEKRQSKLLEKKQEEEKRRLKELDTDADSRNHFLRTLLKFDGKSELDREALTALIEKIHIFPDKRIEIVFCFRSVDFSKSITGGSNHK